MKTQDILKYKDPFLLFAEWLGLAKNCQAIREPTAMTLATANKEGQPSARTVLLKEFSAADGFIFFTNYESKKGQDLATNPLAALLFYWDPLFKQIKIRGSTQLLPRPRSEDYWNTRPRASQLAGWVSQQSQALAPGASLEKLYEEAQDHWQNRPIPCPPTWGGYQLLPHEIEFWVGVQHRLHQRILFTKVQKTWHTAQLFP